jgi:hypothetical protein
MKRHFRLACVGVAGLLMIGCASTPHNEAINKGAQHKEIAVSLYVKPGESPVDVEPDRIAMAPIVFSDSSARISTSIQGPLNLSIDVAKDRHQMEGWDSRAVPGDFKDGNDYVVTFGHITPEPEHYRLVKLTAEVKDPNNQKTENSYYFRYRNRWEWSGITSPILYVINGNSASFTASRFSPSLASGMKYNFSGETFPFIAINALLSVAQKEAKLPTDAKTYQATFGVALDLSGYVQVGTILEPGTNNYLLVLGFRPEYLAKLFGDSGL